MSDPEMRGIESRDMDNIKLAMKEARARLQAKDEKTPLLDFWIDKLEKDYGI